MLGRRFVLPVVLAMAASSVGAVFAGAGIASAAPGTPGVAQAPRVVYVEDFEHGQGATPTQLPSYIGAPAVSETYSADPAYLTNCNGWIASRQQPPFDPAPGCDGFYSVLEFVAGALGQWNGSGSGNHALVAGTALVGPGPNRVVLQTAAPIPVAANRFLTIRADVADVGCPAIRSQTDFVLLDGATAYSTFSSPVEPCATPQANIGGVALGTYLGDNPPLFPGSAAGIRVVGRQGGDAGNDFAIDRLSIVDVTPQLDKAFSAAVVPEHGSVTLVYTITNTSELAGKNGWTFTDAMPAGLLADRGSVQTTCPGFSAGGSPTSYTALGSLAAGQTSCTVSLRVTASAPGTHTTCAPNVTASAGLLAPGCASVYFNAEPVVSTAGPYAGQEGTAVTVAGSVSDVDGPSLGSTWGIAPASGVDPGATCSIANPAVVTTTVTCTDDGVYTLTLTASDGFNPPVARSTTLTLTNVAPAVSFSSPGNGSLFVRGTSVSFTAPFTDIGANDTHTCSVDFADGTVVTAGTVTESPGSGTCTITHTFTAIGPHNVLVRVADDDGGATTAVVKVVIYLPGEAFAVQANGLVSIPKTPLATCPPDESTTTASLSAGIGTVNALHADCTLTTDDGTTTARASVQGASLLGGAIRITDINSTCAASAAGITRSSSVGTINGIPIGLGSASLTIPGVATVFYNETTTSGGKLAQNAIRINTLLGQEITLAGCRLG